MRGRDTLFSHNLARATLSHIKSADDAEAAFISESELQILEIGARINMLPPKGALTFIGLGSNDLREVLRWSEPVRRMLRLDLAGALTAETAIQRILDDLADLAAALWPDWNGQEPCAMSGIQFSWRRAAARLVRAGRRPRFRRLSPGLELDQLLRTLSGLVLLADVDPTRSDHAAPIIATLEWCRRHGAIVVALLAEQPPCEPPWDRLLHGAFAVERQIEPALHRLLPPLELETLRGSAIEKRMREALRADGELSGLFEDEVTLFLGPLGPSPRVDLLWRVGKIVVELDGAEHGRDPNYGADRHRDYELLVAGYLVLRLTNAEVETDLGRALEKVRRVVNLRREAT